MRVARWDGGGPRDRRGLTLLKRDLRAFVGAFVRELSGPRCSRVTRDAIKGNEMDVREQFWAFTQSAHGLAHGGGNFELGVSAHLPKLVSTPTEYFFVALFKVGRRGRHDIQTDGRVKICEGMIWGTLRRTRIAWGHLHLP